MANKHMQKHAIPLIFRELQIKTAMKYHYTFIRFSKIDGVLIVLSHQI